MSLNKGFYESVINKLIDEEIIKKYDKNDKYIDKKAIDTEEGNIHSDNNLSEYFQYLLNLMNSK